MTTVVVITGASAGIGRATALEFARQGCSVGLLAREPQRLESACVEVARSGGKAVGVPTDVACAEQVEQAAARIELELGPIDVWVNNAMVSVFAPFEALSVEEYERVTRVTYLGTVNGTRSALRRMMPRNHGCILQVGSALAYRSIPLQSAYCGAKAAVRGFTDSVRAELIHRNSKVRIAMIQLSAFNTPQFDWSRSHLPRRVQPVPPIFQPELAARAIAWVASHPRREFWVGWPAVKAILSTRLLPALGDRLAARNAWDSQQTVEESWPRPDNLFEPVSGEYGTHGRFDSRAKRSMPQLLLAMHRAEVQWATVVIALVAISFVLA